MSDPGFTFGQVPTPAQWNNAFAQKQDALNYSPVNKAGDVMTGKLTTVAPTASIAGFALLPGITPSVPVNGDLWMTGTGIFARVNGSNVQLSTGGVVNSGTALQLAWYAASGAAVSGNPNLTVFNGALTLGVPASIAGTVILSGIGSGGVTLAGASAGGSGTITFPSGTVDFSATGGTSQVVKQTSVGGIFSVARLSVTDLSNTTTGTGAIVLASAPILISPTLGSASFTSLTGPLIALTNGTSGSISLQAQNGTLGSPTITFPAVTGSIIVTGSAGGTIPSLTVSLGSDVVLNGTGAFFDGPSIAQGTNGTWLVSATVTLTDTSGGTGAFYAKLWDGTTVIASSAVNVTTVANGLYTLSLSGVITSPVGNLRVSCRDTATVNGKILFNATGNSKDSTITAVRIN